MKLKFTPLPAAGNDAWWQSENLSDSPWYYKGWAKWQWWLEVGLPRLTFVNPELDGEDDGREV